MKKSLIASALVLMLAFPVLGSATEKYRLAVYYYPGWLDNAEGLFAPKPWDLIKPYPEREPLLGWYREGNVPIMEQHIAWMKEYRISQLVFDWYWDGPKNLPYLSHALDAYLSAANRHDVEFAIHWANHRPFPLTAIQFDRMVQYWLAKILKEPGYWYEDGKPVVFVFSADLLETSANRIGKTTQQLLDRADELARERGVPGIKFVVNSDASWGSNGPTKRGYSALTGYVHRRGFSGKVEPFPTDYLGLTNGYDMTWSWIINNLTIEYWPPVVFGWDQRPWGGVEKKDTCCANTPAIFEAHLTKAKLLVDKYPERTKRTVMICCWNEFGEGNYIEPTKKDGFTYLEILRRVFASP
jgi:hypothetical protein